MMQDPALNDVERFCDLPEAVDPLDQLEKAFERQHQWMVSHFLAGGLAHRMNNLLSGVLGFVGIAPNAPGPMIVEMSQRVADEVDKASQLTHGVLSMTRASSHAKPPCDAMTSTRKVSTLAQMGGGRNVAVRADLPDESVWVAAPGPQWEWALLSLLGGIVEALGDVEDGELLVQLRARVGEATLSVEAPGDLAPWCGKSLRQKLNDGESIDLLFFGRRALERLARGAQGAASFDSTRALLRVPLASR